ncbi:MAG: hypothetical protein WCS37_14145 [Chloroflexota bacterium]
MLYYRWLSQPEIQAYWSSHTGYYPMRKASYSLKEMQDFIAQVPQFQIAVDQLRATEPSYATQGAVFGTFPSTRQKIETAMSQFMLGQFSSPKAALDDAAKQANAELQKYNAALK